MNSRHTPKSVPAKLCAALILVLGLFTFVVQNAHGQARVSRSRKPEPARAVKQYTIEQFMNTVRIGGSSFSSDEKSILFHSNRTGIFNVYSVPVSGGGPTQLTRSTKESTYAVSFIPGDSRILYTYDRGGN